MKGVDQSAIIDTMQPPSSMTLLLGSLDQLLLLLTPPLAPVELDGVWNSTASFLIGASRGPSPQAVASAVASVWSSERACM